MSCQTPPRDALRRDRDRFGALDQAQDVKPSTDSSAVAAERRFQTPNPTIARPVAVFVPSPAPGAAVRAAGLAVVRPVATIVPSPPARNGRATSGPSRGTRREGAALGSRALMWHDPRPSNAGLMAVGMRGFDRVQLPGNASRGCRSGLVKRRQNEVTGNRQPALALAA